MSKLAIIFIGHGTLEITNYDDIEAVKEAIRFKNKWVEIETHIINIDNVAYVEERV